MTDQAKSAANQNGDGKKAKATITRVDDMTADSIREIFQQAADESSKKMQDFVPGLQKLSTLISKLHDTGALTEIGLEVATFDNLRALKLTKNLTQQPFCLLRIQDACFLLRVNSGSIIDLHIDNQNYARENVRSLDDDKFWKNGDTAKYYSYDLKKEDDCIALMEVVIQSAGVRAASRSLDCYNVTPQSRSTLNSKRSLV